MLLIFDYILECATNTYMSYNNSNPFCIELMTSGADCSDMNAACGQARTQGELLKITDSSVMKDAIAVFQT